MDSALPLVSIVIPTYNHARLLHRALNSVLSQTYPCWEATVVDNYSQDDTDLVLAGYQDPRIKLVKFSNKGVIAASRNVGVRHSSGQWIAFLDSDDWWKPDKLRECMEAVTPYTYLVYHDLDIAGARSFGLFKRTMKSRKLATSATIDLLVGGNPIATSSVVVRKNILEDVGGMSEEPAMAAAEDYHTWLLISQQPGQLQYVGRSLGFYLVHANGVSQKDMSRSMYAAVSDFLPLLSREQKQVAFSRIVYARARFLVLKGRGELAMRHLLYCTRHGDAEIKLKALAMVLAIRIKKIRRWSRW